VVPESFGTVLIGVACVIAATGLAASLIIAAARGNKGGDKR
jgi:hypothetical protein